MFRLKGRRGEWVQLGVVASFLWTTCAIAQVDAAELAKRALNNLQHELLVCSAFYMVSAIGMERLSDPTLAQSQKASADLAWNFAAEIGKQIGQKPEVIGIRVNMAVEDIKAEMNGNFVNYSIILQKYAKPCAENLANPTQRLEEIMVKLSPR